MDVGVNLLCYKYFTLSIILLMYILVVNFAQLLWHEYTSILHIK